MKREAIWKEDLKITEETIPFEQDLAVDILIIGAGLSGMSCAMNLLNSNKKIAIIEKEHVGEGITSLSTGKLDFMQGLVYHKIINVRSFLDAKLYYESQMDAINLATQIINDYHINCNYVKTNGYVFTNDEKEIPTFQKEISFYEKMGIPYEEITRLPNGYPCLYGIKTMGSAVIHPLKYLLELKKIVEKKIPIYEKVTAKEIKRSYGKFKVTTSKGILWAKKVIVCTHYPFFIKPAYIPFKTHIEKSYVLASKTNKIYKMHAITSKKPITSMRYYKNDVFLMATNSHTTSSKDDDKKHFQDLENEYLSHFDGKITHIWSTHDIMTSDHLPYIGKIDTNLFLATGFKKWGMTNGILSGKILADLVFNKKNKYMDLFSLSRKQTPKKFVNLMVSNFQTSKTFVSMKLEKNKNFYQRAKVIKENGKDIGVYSDGKKEYRVYNKCPHMGCSLLFNEGDKTWDCPCHGSRFTIQGDVISGPSTYSIRIK